MTTKAISVKGLCKVFAKGLLWPTQVVRALDSVSFDVDVGEIFGLLGPNGSGKTTLLRILSTALLPDSGEVRIFGHDVVCNADEIRRIVSWVKTEGGYFDHLSAEENLLYFARLHGLSTSAAKGRIREVLSALKFDEGKIGVLMEDLSRGMRQKVLLCRALLSAPALLLLDEPTTGLDPRSRRDVQDFILALRAQGVTIVLASHDMHEVERLCDRVAIIDGGRIVALGSVRELKERARAKSLEEVFIALTGKVLEVSE